MEAEASTDSLPLPGFVPRKGAGLPLFGKSSTYPPPGPVSMMSPLHVTQTHYISMQSLEWRGAGLPLFGKSSTYPRPAQCAPIRCLRASDLLQQHFSGAGLPQFRKSHRAAQ